MRVFSAEGEAAIDGDAEREEGGGLGSSKGVRSVAVASETISVTPVVSTLGSEAIVSVEGRSGVWDTEGPASLRRRRLRENSAM